VSAEVRATVSTENVSTENVSTENVSTEAGSGARERLLPMVFGFYPAQVLHTLVRLDIPDLLADGPAGVGQLAGRCGAHPPSLRRLLRAAVGLGLLADGGDRYELTDAGQLLRTGVPGSVRNLVLLFHGNATWRSWGRLEESVRTGEAAFPHVVGQEPGTRSWPPGSCAGAARRCLGPPCCTWSSRWWRPIRVSWPARAPP